MSTSNEQYKQPRKTPGCVIAHCGVAAGDRPLPIAEAAPQTDLCLQRLPQVTDLAHRSVPKGPTREAAARCRPHVPSSPISPRSESQVAGFVAWRIPSAKLTWLLAARRRIAWLFLALHPVERSLGDHTSHLVRHVGVCDLLGNASVLISTSTAGTGRGHRSSGEPLAENGAERSRQDQPNLLLLVRLEEVEDAG